MQNPHPMTDPKVKANEIVEKYREVLGLKYIHSRNAYIACAISEVEGKIALLNEMLETNLHNDFDILNRRGEYLAILQELKNMNQ